MYPLLCLVSVFLSKLRFHGDDDLQAGNIGVLQGAERFDQSRGYKFSTYVQYWVRKSMSTLVAKHARGIRIPVCFLDLMDCISLNISR